jgi:hypothetical protein
LIKSGEIGYYPVKTFNDPPLQKNETNDQFVDRMNATNGVTKGQRKAMQWGSQFGWHTPGANSDLYNEDGSMKKGVLA